MIHICWFFLSILIFVCTSIPGNAQTPTIITGAPPLDRSLNLLQNGSFEEPRHTDGDTTVWPATIDGEGYYFVGPNNILYTPIGFPDGWTVTGGGTDTYAIWGNRYAMGSGSLVVSGIAYSDPSFDGDRHIYLGNSFISEITEVPVFMPNGEVVFNSTPTITPGPGYGPDPLTVTQIVSDLIPGRLYRLSFWISAEWTNPAALPFPFTNVIDDSIMGLQIEGYDLLYLTVPAGPLNSDLHVFGADPFHVYTVEFTANDTDMDISFLNWGHYSPGFTAGWTGELTTEMSMDDVILNIVNVILDVTIEGNGHGRVDSTNPGIDCSSTEDNDCDETYLLNTMVTLTATPDPGSFFVGWSGDPECLGPDPTDPVLNLTMTMDISCIATFELRDFVLNPIFPALDDNINFISAENATPNENVAFVWGKKPGEFTLGGRICNGATFGIDKPNLLAIERANEFGIATYIFYIPFFSDLEFSVQLHALDIDSCRISNQIEQVIRKDDEGDGSP